MVCPEEFAFGGSLRLEFITHVRNLIYMLYHIVGPVYTFIESLPVSGEHPVVRLHCTEKIIVIQIHYTFLRIHYG